MSEVWGIEAILLDRVAMRVSTSIAEAKESVECLLRAAVSNYGATCTRLEWERDPFYRHEGEWAPAWKARVYYESA